MAIKRKGLQSYDDLKQLRELRDKDKLVEYVQSKAAQINQRFYRLEKAGVGINDTAYRYARIDTGKDKPRYTESKNKLNQLTTNELIDLAVDINAKIESPTSSIRGIRQVTEKRVSGSYETLDEDIRDNVSEEQYQRALERGLGQMMNKARKLGMDSGQVRDDWMSWTSKGLTTREFLEAFNSREVKASNRVNDYGALDRAWTRIYNRPSVQRRIKKK